jgi:hypothetical protein
VLLYQARITAILNVFALQAIALSLSVAWQSLIQDAPHLLVTAAIALLVKGVFIPAALHRIVRQLGIHREIEEVIGAGPTMLTGLGLVALSILRVPGIYAETRLPLERGAPQGPNPCEPKRSTRSRMRPIFSSMRSIFRCQRSPLVQPIFLLQNVKARIASPTGHQTMKPRIKSTIQAGWIRIDGPRHR